ncbi:SUMF1/EgtB/PvdO family nonheme iron enzyme [Geminicoccus roseus]|uniref:SUMF1/EgtB/PvdO family nonheme iron enzyme n=1 Tax=Geminicoccus roseus TaxID=404900 RepID=UPI00040337ED|nr:SUMF1/EgtB/PvdO family nonheme iron enzyme [Geminicoccus roseus]
MPRSWASLVVGLCIWTVAAIAAGAAEAEKRLALVIGIANYQYAPALMTPVNDAQVIAVQLRALKFDVDLQVNLDARELGSALREFGIRASDADVAVIYYAGHGVQVDGNNYLLPADTELKRVRDLLYEAMPLQLFLGELAGANKLGIMILDACRDNPFVDRLAESMGTSRSNQIGQGLGRVDDTPTDTFVAMSTRANAVAEDGRGQHSPFAQAIIEEMKTPGLELGLFFRRVRDRVLQATEGRQEPYTFGSLGAAPFYFNPKPPNQAPTLAATDPLEVLDDAGPTHLGIEMPSDPDGDSMVVQIVRLPRGGNVMVSGRPVLIGEYLTPEQLRSAMYDPDGSVIGDAGLFQFVVDDRQGGRIDGAVAVAVSLSNQPPVVPPVLSFQAMVNRLPVDPPTDPDGDRITVRVREVPESGKVRLGERILAPGDRIDPNALARLTYDSENAPVGSSQELVLVTEDERGSSAQTTVLIAVVDGSGAALPPMDAAPPPAPPPVPVASAEPAPAVVEAPEVVPDEAEAKEAQPAGLPAEVVEPEVAVAEVEPAEVEPPVSDPAGAVAGDAGAGSEPPVAMAPDGTVLEPMPGRFEAAVDANLRQRPDASSPRVGRIAKGTPLKAIGRVAGSTWVYVEPQDGEPAFIFGGGVAELPEPPPALAVAEAAPEKAPEPPAAPTDDAPQVMADAAAQAPIAVRNHEGVRDCAYCPPLVRIDPGSFTMGSSGSDASRKPTRQVTIEKPFALGRFEVTVAEWSVCVQAGACTLPRMTEPAEGMPIHNIHWEDAMAYLGWLSRSTGKTYRLPSEAEWEFAARGGTASRYWWGDRIEAGKVICRACEGSGFQRLRPPMVDAQPANPFGLVGVSGGVAEWVADCWFDSYVNAPTDGSVRDAPNCRRRVLRGGSWRDEAANLEVSSRNFYDADVRYLTNGFRVARDLE